LKLAGMPNTFPTPKAEAPKAVAPKIEAPKPAPPPVAKAEVAKAEPPKLVAPKPEPPKAQAPKPAPAAPPAPSWLDSRDWMRTGLWALAALLILVSGWLALGLARRMAARARARKAVPEPATVLAEEGPIIVAEELPASEPEANAQGRAVVSSDAALATRLP